VSQIAFGVPNADSEMVHAAPFQPSAPLSVSSRLSCICDAMHHTVGTGVGLLVELEFAIW